VTTKRLKSLAGTINDTHAAAGASFRAGVQHAMEAGRLLIEAKEQVGHGEWLPWLRANCEFSERTAQAYMRVAKRAGELEASPQRVADLPLREALALLAAPQPQEPTVEGGETIEAIEAKIEAFLETVCPPLAIIRDKRLHRETHETFEDYVSERFLTKIEDEEIREVLRGIVSARMKPAQDSEEEEGGEAPRSSQTGAREPDASAAPGAGEA